MGRCFKIKKKFFIQIVWFCKRDCHPSIEKGKTTLVTVHEDKRHSYQEGDYVIFREVEGMT